MQSLPDWIWKVISLLVVPLGAWVWNAQASITIQELKMDHLAEKVEDQDKRVQEISDLKSDIKVLETKMDTVLEEIGDMKKMMVAK
jgi:Tfp pilus assembly protein PilN